VYLCFQWVNGKKACEHSGGHLPFQADITQLLLYGTANTVTVAVNNTLTSTTLPQGYVQYPNDTAR
jgi:beta-glucuronidase